jgi:hypothetical protein
MSMLEIPGSFTMLVPDRRGWAVTKQGRGYELTRPDDENAALHISVYERAGSALGDDEAAELLGHFISTAGGGSDVTPQILRESRSQHRAVARFITTDQDSSFELLAFLVLWRDRFLLCSCTATPGSPTLEEAEQMFATIFPPKKGLLRRA